MFVNSPSIFLYGPPISRTEGEEGSDMTLLAFAQFYLVGVVVAFIVITVSSQLIFINIEKGTFKGFLVSMRWSRVLLTALLSWVGAGAFLGYLAGDSGIE